MAYRQFKADVALARQHVEDGHISGLSALRHGDSDGELVIKFHHDRLKAPLRVHVVLDGEVDYYPNFTSFIAFTEAEDTPQDLVKALEDCSSVLTGLKPLDMAVKLAHILNDSIDKPKTSIDRVHDKHVETGDQFNVGDDDNNPQNRSTVNEDPNEDPDEDSNEDLNDDPYEDPYEMLLDDWPSWMRKKAQAPVLSPSQAEKLLRLIRRDLRKVRDAGYKVGLLDDMGKDLTHGVFSISICIKNLSLTEEAVEAWDLKPEEYLVLLIRFPEPYKTLDEIVSTPISTCDFQINFAIGKCSKYKPDLQSAMAAVSGTPSRNHEDETGASSDTPFQRILVSDSLGRFMTESFLHLLRLRVLKGISWDEANTELKARQTVNHHPSADNALESDPQSPTGSYNDMTPLSDHLGDTADKHGRSLPLVAMEFALRYFTQCTEFCLRCHQKLDNEFGAIRPYVCENPLCLFQYQSFGLGSSIEHEIITQPYAVDLLVSLCYTSIQKQAIIRPLGRSEGVGRLGYPIRDFPVGLNFLVPNLETTNLNQSATRVEVDGGESAACLKLSDPAASFHRHLTPGTWVAFRKLPVSATENPPLTHGIICAVDINNKAINVDTICESGKVDTHVGPGYYSTFGDNSEELARTSQPTACGYKYTGELYQYDVGFDTLSEDGKALTMRHVLDTLPSILAIEEFLSASPYRRLAHMTRVSPAAVALLQWIVSSNRSCISQVDRSRSLVATVPVGPDADERPAGSGRNREDERIPDMEGWAQFKFMQGSPDKELQFKRALEKLAQDETLGLIRHPTIFAWHGSPLYNWHSIVRTGLDYVDLRTGRSYGNGVYFSDKQGVSMGYSGSAIGQWPNSDLKFNSCMSLNEIINVPSKFVSQSPHYVVANNSWHQCRYLFVQTNRSNDVLRQSSRAQPPAEPDQNSQAMTPSNSSSGRQYFIQAPGREIKGPTGRKIEIPLAAIPQRVVSLTPTAPNTAAKRPLQDLLDEDKDVDKDDAVFLYSDDDSETPDEPNAQRLRHESPGGATDATMLAPTPISTQMGPASSPTADEATLTTDFCPGTLLLSGLPRLQAPSWATDIASQALGRELSALQKIQTKTPLHELGWYINFDEVDNLFQWIVELHSFDSELPLAKDMKTAGCTSVVVEIRFPSQFPFSPPFVRVIRPRFLPFQQGGGGHVTAGGAICMELLTMSGWTPANSMESVLLQVHMALSSLDPKPARLAGATALNDYQVDEAVDAYIRAARAHGWTVPDDLKQTAHGI
ncbi:hypothetical protein GQ53DRAFT_836607 [Thozetella sp. PMI_491]|nr:hypothetical protein GQ53DRAFT_836607 [Thozetella sp. PMI_491]